MPSFVIDEIHVGDIVQGDVVLRDVVFGGLTPEPVYTLPYFPDEPIRQTLPVPEEILFQ